MQTCVTDVRDYKTTRIARGYTTANSRDETPCLARRESEEIRRRQKKKKTTFELQNTSVLIDLSVTLVLNYLKTGSSFEEKTLTTIH